MTYKIALVQQDIVWENISANMQVVQEIFEKLQSRVDLVVLPEMFLTGFSMNVNKIAISMNSPEVFWLQDLASKYDLAIIGSLAIKEYKKIFNRALFVKPEGEIACYDKRHLFRMGGEEKCYNSGDQRVVVTHKGIRILPQICYDLRFPVWSRNQNDYDLMVYMANWPSSRHQVWDVLLHARAIENQCYVIGVNRIGKGGDIQYKGGSMAINFKGNDLLDMSNKINDIAYVNIDTDELYQFRNKFPAYVDADNFTIDN
jgi:predicted amidohydrolase